MQFTANFWLQTLIVFPFLYMTLLTNIVSKDCEKKLKRKKLTHVLTIGYETKNIRMWTDPNSLYRNDLILINHASAQIFLFVCLVVVQIKLFFSSPKKASCFTEIAAQQIFLTEVTPRGPTHSYRADWVISGDWSSSSWSLFWGDPVRC